MILHTDRINTVQQYKKKNNCSIEAACVKTKIVSSAYYSSLRALQDKGQIPKSKTKKRKSKMITLAVPEVAPITESKLIFMMGSSADIATALKGLNYA